MSRGSPRVARWILACAAVLVPTARRRAWRRQWIAELEHRDGDTATRRGSIRFAMGSVAHAAYMRRQEMTMRGWWGDLRHTARALAHKPGFSLLTLATLAVGIGAATAIFSIAEAVLLRPVPMDGGDRLVRIYSSNPSRGMDRFSVSYPDFVDFGARTDLFESASVYIDQQRDISGEGDPERVRVSSVHEGFFQTLRTPPLLGRVFEPDDHAPTAEATAVLAESFWARRFGADSTLLGRTIRLDGVPQTVIGIVADRLSWPGESQVWTPLRWGGTAPDWAAARSNHTWQVVARLQPGVGVDAASAQVRAVSRQIYSAEGVDEREAGTEALVVGLGASVGAGETGPILAVMGAAVFLVLLIACMNASGLLLTRAWGRARELSLRAALGAGRGRIMWILLGESLLLALSGGAIGVLLAHWGLRRAVRSIPPGGPDLTAVALNPVVLGVALAISVGAALLAGLLPALRASRISVAEALKEGGTQSSQGRSGTRLRRGLVVAELALSLTLLVGAGLTIRAFQRQIDSDPGFEASNLLTFKVRLPATRYEEDALIQAYFEAALERLQRLPGVTAAASTSRLPLGGGGMGLYRSFVFDGAPPPPEGAAHLAAWVEVDPEYFDALGIRPLEGRAFDHDDGEAAPLVAMVNRRLAAQMSPDEPIVGRVIRSRFDENLPRTVVGVVGDLQFDGISREQGEAVVLVPRGQATRASMAFLVRTVGDPSDAVPAVRQTMTELEPDVALADMRSLREGHSQDLAGVRFLTLLFATFGVLALALAVSGVYGLVSYSVSQQTQEIGVRMAMGATAASVRGRVMAEGALLAGIGLAIGMAVAYAFSRVLSAAFFGLTSVELPTFLAVAALLVAAVALASWFPAIRATRVDPVEALRSE